MAFFDFLRPRRAGTRPSRDAGPYGTGGLTGGRPLPQPARFGRQREERRGLLHFLWAGLSVLVILALAVLWLATSTSFLTGAERQEVPALAWRACAGAPDRSRCVVDGDTIRLRGETIRVAGLDAPELAGRCEAERIASRAARDALIAWLNGGAFTLREPEGGARDKYGRPLRTLSRGMPPARSDAAEALVAAGLARTYAGGSRIDWCTAGSA